MKVRAFRILLSLTLALSSCAQSKSNAVALQGIREFHTLYNNSEFEKIYDAASPEARQKISRQNFVEDMKAMRLGQGAESNTEPVAIDYNYLDGISMTKVLVRVTFEKGIANEEFIFDVSEAKPKLTSYHFLGPAAGKQ